MSARCSFRAKQPVRHALARGPLVWPTSQPTFDYDFASKPVRAAASPRSAKVVHCFARSKGSRHNSRIGRRPLPHRHRDRRRGGNVGAGVDVIGIGGASFRLYYDGRFSDLI